MLLFKSAVITTVIAGLGYVRKVYHEFITPVLKIPENSMAIELVTDIYHDALKVYAHDCRGHRAGRSVGNTTLPPKKKPTTPPPAKTSSR
jgi:hypothetical protein